MLILFGPWKILKENQGVFFIIQMFTIFIDYYALNLPPSLLKKENTHILIITLEIVTMEINAIIFQFNTIQTKS